jgi:hypothetical protein
MSSKGNLLFDVDGFNVYRDSIYVVRDKEDLSAPSGFIQAGVTKLPSDGIKEMFQCRYIQKSAKTGVWDTGFYEYSPCYAGIQKEIIQDKIKRLQENVIEPYKQSVGNPNALNHGDDEFWSGLNFSIYTGQVFNTENPEDVLTLYFALLTKQLTPKGLEGDSRYSNSAYVCLDITEDTKKKDERSSKKFRAVGIFENLLNTDKPRLVAMLNYANLVVSPEIENDAFRGLFDQYLSTGEGFKNIDTFLRLVDETSDDVGRSKVAIYIKLKESYSRNNKVTKNPNGVFYYEDQEIGPDLKAAATNIARTEELKDVKKALLLENED